MASQQKSEDDFTCPICMYIMIQPVTMPCKHSLCMICYEQCVEKASLACPICRMRISVWARRNSKSKTLVDVEMWKTIQKRFPLEVKNKMEGKDSSDDNWDSPNFIEREWRRIQTVSAPGEIRQEYEAELAKLERQRQEEAKTEEEASAALIKALQEQEEEELASLTMENQEAERLGREAAQLLDQVANVPHRHLRDESKRLGRSTSRTGRKQNRSESASLKLDSFYSSVRKTSNSAPPYSELATTLTRCQKMTKTSVVLNSNYSPYPFHCMSPSEKQKSPSIPLEDVSPDLEEETFDLLKEHSYTTASAEAIDLTSRAGECDLSSILRDDVVTYVKTEPPDINEEEPLLNSALPRKMDECQTFQPIDCSLRTPPKKLPSGDIFDPELIRTIPRNLTFGLTYLSNRVPSSPSVSSCSSEIFPDQNLNFRNEVLVSQSQECGITSTPSVSLGVGSKEAIDDYIDKMTLTRKIVYSTYNRHPTNSPSSTSSRPAASSSKTQTTRAISSQTQTTSHPSTSSLSSSSISSKEQSLRCVNNNILLHDLDPVVSLEKHTIDHLITDGTNLIIPLESNIQPGHTNSSHTNTSCGESLHYASYCRSDQRKTDSTQVCKSKAKLSLSNQRRQPVSKIVKKKTSLKKGNAPPSVPSVRGWCVTNKGKSSSHSSQSSHQVDDFIKNNNKRPLSPEEADHLLALELQRKFDELDKRQIKVDRSEGSSNEYLLRKKKRLH